MDIVVRMDYGKLYHARGAVSGNAWSPRVDCVQMCVWGGGVCVRDVKMIEARSSRPEPTA